MVVGSGVMGGIGSDVGAIDDGVDAGGDTDDILLLLLFVPIVAMGDCIPRRDWTKEHNRTVS